MKKLALRFGLNNIGIALRKRNDDNGNKKNDYGNAAHSKEELTPLPLKTRRATTLFELFLHKNHGDSPEHQTSKQNTNGINTKARVEQSLI